jgi:hypothetical protein
MQLRLQAMVDGADATERASKSLAMMGNIFVGAFAFELIDRLSGGSLNIAVPVSKTISLKMQSVIGKSSTFQSVIRKSFKNAIRYKKIFDFSIRYRKQSSTLKHVI